MRSHEQKNEASNFFELQDVSIAVIPDIKVDWESTKFCVWATLFELSYEMERVLPKLWRKPEKMTLS